MNGLSTTTNDPRPARLRSHLLARIGRRFQTVTETHALGDLSFDFTRIADPDRVLDETQDDAIQLPYWAELWDSAPAIARHLVETHAHTGRPMSVLDLGCGMGFAGCVAARLGHRVMFADLDPAALLFARVNSIPDIGRVRFRQINWQNEQLGEPFDLILGADIVYERPQWEYLASFWQKHLGPAGEVLLGEPGRSSGDVFCQWIATRGWRIDILPRPIPHKPSLRLIRLSLIP
jgi:predicted nicotinamide N-methyase